MNKNELCPTCDQVLPDGHAYFIGRYIEAEYGGYGNAWEQWAEESEGFAKVYPKIGELTLVAKTPSLGENQGEDNRPVFMIFELGGRFYRKNGIADSYGEVNWHGPFKNAKPVIKQVTEWE